MRVLGFVVACLMFAGGAVAQTADCTFTYFTLPSPYYATIPNGINRYGNIVGNAWSKLGQTSQAFIRYSDGSFKTFTLNGNLPTEFQRRNASGVTVGSFRAPSGRTHGLVYHNGATRMVDYPNAANTWLMGINMYGTIVGYYRDADGRAQGFKLKNGVFTSVRFPEAVSTTAASISDTGVIVGWYQTSSSPHHRGFILRNGVYSKPSVARMATRYPASGRSAMTSSAHDGVRLVGCEAREEVGEDSRAAARRRSSSP